MLNAIATLLPFSTIEGDVITAGDFTITCTLTGKIKVTDTECGHSQIVGNTNLPVAIVVDRARGFMKFCCS